MLSIQELILKFAEYGKIQGEEGINRVFGSREYFRAAEELKAYMDMLQMESYIDPVGNVHGFYRTGNVSGKELLVGSHLDTVKNGGMFDGLLGVAAGLFCVQKLREEKRELNYDIHLVASNGEEGNELGGTFGSRCMTGSIDVSDEAFMKRAEKYQIFSQDILSSEMDFSPVSCYLELHIEQGNYLNCQSKEIGVVTGIVGLERYQVEINGIENHSGTTPMDRREDALVHAAQMIVFADELAGKYPDHFTATFSKVEILPNTLAVINQKVSTVLEIRSIKTELMEQYMEELSAYCSAHYGDSIVMKPVIKKNPVQMEKNIVEAIEKVCEEKRVPYMRMVSGATHDGNIYANKIPVGMIFVPSKDGISHSSREWTDWEKCKLGAEILYQTLFKINF